MISKKRKLKIILKILITVLFVTLQSCNWDNENEFTPVIPETGTGMWFVGQYNTNGDARFVKGFTINKIQYAFLADGQNGLQIINISNPSAPVLTANYKTNGNVKEVFIDSVNGYKYAFISDLINGLYIVDISNPANPVTDTIISYPGGVNSVFLKNGYLYTAINSGNVKAINISSLPDSLYEASSYSPINSVEHIEISDNSAFFIERTTGLEIADISNPEMITFLATFKSSGSCYDLKIGGNLAYIADGTAGICIVNIGNTSQPYFVNQENTYSDVRGIDYSPNFMFTAEYNEGAEVFNLFNPSYPEEVGYFEPEDYCYSVNYYRGKILIANGQKGLLILRF